MIYEVVSEVGRFGPLSEDHPMVSKWPRRCAECGAWIKAGDVPTFVNSMPAGSEDIMRAAEGKAYTAVVDIAHEGCAAPYREGGERWVGRSS